MKAIGRKVSLALPVRTNWSITSGIEVSEASLQIGHEVSPYSMISTGASALAERAARLRGARRTPP